MPTTAAKPTAREKLLAAADELFYEEGIHTVGIDRVIEKAGVAKASLYNTFGSKDDLVREYLQMRHHRREARINRWLAKADTPKARVLAVFDAQAELFAEPSFKGCAFINANAECQPGGPISKLTDEYRAWIRELLLQLTTEAGAKDPSALTEQLVLLYDGALVGAQMDRNPATAGLSKTLAESLINAACTRRTG